MIGVGATIPPVHRQLRSQRANLAIAVMERAPAAPELRLMGRGQSELKALRESGSAVRGAAVARAWRNELLRRLPEVAAATSTVSVLWLALNRGLPPAEAAGALAVLAILVQPLRDLATVWDYRCAWVIACDKIAALLSAPTLDPPDTQRVRPRKQARERAPARLAFKRVHRGACCELDAVAEPGMKVAIIGPNGAGKSTCLALAAGLDAADEGAVELDGRDLAAMPVAERRRSIVFVGPRSPILKGSLRRALTLGVTPRPADRDIEGTALDFGLCVVLDRLGGLDGKVAEAGRNLSSGETLRLHLVRAALAKPRLFLLDEVDQALDPDGAAAFRRLIRTTPATTLFATRDPTLARQADVLWYMQSGRVCAAGPPGDLIEHVACVARWFRPRDAA
jgi:ABC-type transport system involved in cytochrome bd biosynthesis fused ATPase/permease subunit